MNKVADPLRRGVRVIGPGMEIINHLAGSLAQSAAVTRQQSVDKTQQIRHAQARRKDIAAASDTFEHQVESTEELTPIHDEQEPSADQRRRSRREQAASDATQDTPGIDITG